MRTVYVRLITHKYLSSNKIALQIIHINLDKVRINQIDLRSELNSNSSFF